MCQRYAAGFQRHGVKKGEKVLVHLDNSLENMIAMYSVIFAGGVAAVSDPILSNDDILYRIRDSNATHILTTASEAKRFSDFRNKMHVKGYFSVGTAPGFVSVSDFKKLNEDTFQELPVADVKKEAVALLYTSGTTGSPKAAEHTHYSIVAFLPRPGCHQVSSDHDVVASCISITSTFAFRFYLRGITSGAKTVLLSKSTDADKMVDAIRKYKVTTMFGGLHWIVLLAKAIEKRGIQLDSLTTVFLCGAKATPQILRKIERSFDLAIVKDTYGATEIGQICTPPLGATSWYGIGFPSPMVHVKVVDVKSGNVLGPNEQGEVLVKTPCSMKGYYGHPEATSQKITPDGWVRTDDILYRIRDSNATHILTTASEAKRFSDFRNKMHVKGYFSVGTAPGFVSVSDFKKLNEDTFQELPVADVKKEAVALLYTSGTTGSPKAAEHTHYSIVAFLPRPGCHQVSSDHDVVASCISITSTFAFRFYLRGITSGAKTVLLSKSTDADKMVDAIRKYKVTTMFGGLHWIVLLAKAIEKRGIQLDSLTTVFLCGAKATPQILRQIERSFDLAIVKDTYGATEIGQICTPPLGATSWYGIGFPSPMVHVKVVDVKSGNVLGPNEQGEVLVKTPCSMKGYYGHPEATSQKITPDGWVRTGDICYYNEVGQFFYVERMSQFFRCMGISVAPCSIESVLLSHDGIEEAVVIGVPHARYQEAAMAYVVLKKPCNKITEAELQNFVAELAFSLPPRHQAGEAGGTALDAGQEVLCPGGLFSQWDEAELELRV
ncbi:4-coumarate--CoA ligase 1 [Ixodes scapularis]